MTDTAERLQQRQERLLAKAFNDATARPGRQVTVFSDADRAAVTEAAERLRLRADRISAITEEVNAGDE